MNDEPERRHEKKMRPAEAASRFLNTALDALPNPVVMLDENGFTTLHEDKAAITLRRSQSTYRDLIPFLIQEERDTIFQEIITNTEIAHEAGTTPPDQRSSIVNIFYRQSSDEEIDQSKKRLEQMRVAINLPPIEVYDGTPPKELQEAYRMHDEMTETVNDFAVLPKFFDILTAIEKGEQPPLGYRDILTEGIDALDTIAYNFNMLAVAPLTEVDKEQKRKSAANILSDPLFTSVVESSDLLKNVNDPSIQERERIHLEMEAISERYKIFAPQILLICAHAETAVKNIASGIER